MTPNISLVIGADALTLVLSIVCSIFVAGVRWGAVNKDIEYIKRDLETIRSLFQLTLAASPAIHKDT